MNISVRAREYTNKYEHVQRNTEIFPGVKDYRNLNTCNRIQKSQLAQGHTYISRRIWEYRNHDVFRDYRKLTEYREKHKIHRVHGNTYNSPSTREYIKRTEYKGMHKTQDVQEIQKVSKHTETREFRISIQTGEYSSLYTHRIIQKSHLITVSSPLSIIEWFMLELFIVLQKRQRLWNIKYPSLHQENMNN